MSQRGGEKERGNTMCAKTPRKGIVFSAPRIERQLLHLEQRKLIYSTGPGPEKVLTRHSQRNQIAQEKEDDEMNSLPHTPKQTVCSVLEFCSFTDSL